MNADTVFELLVTQTCQVTLVGLVVSLLVRWFAHDRPHFAHAMWVLVLMKCVTPPLWSSPTSPFSWWKLKVIPTDRVEHAPLLDKLTPPTIQLQAFGKNGSSSDSVFVPSSTPKRAAAWWRPAATTLFISAWMLGTAIAVLIAMARWVMLWRLIRRQTVSTPLELQTQVQDLARTLRVSRRVRVCVRSQS